MRDRKEDDLKPLSELRRIEKAAKKCTISGCTNPLTRYTGPGSDSCCRDHQLFMVEYGGMGKLERPHTFHRDWVCIDCGMDIRDEPRFADMTDPEEKFIAMRMAMHGDHITQKAAGGGDERENIGSRCILCHIKKTVLNKDYLKNPKIDD